MRRVVALLVYVLACLVGVFGMALGWSRHAVGAVAVLGGVAFGLCVILDAPVSRPRAHG